MTASKEEVNELAEQVRLLIDRVDKLQTKSPAVDVPENTTPVDSQPEVREELDIIQAEQVDVQSDFISIKASLSSIRLETELTVPSEGNKNVRKSDQSQNTIITKSARYVDTAFKILKSSKDSEQKFSELFTVLLAQIRFLQKEHSALIVQGSFDPTVSKFYRHLQGGASFNAEALEHLCTAAAVAAVYRPQGQYNNNQQYSFRGRGRGTQQYRRPGGADFFGQQAGRRFPRGRAGPQNQGQDE